MNSFIDIFSRINPRLTILELLGLHCLHSKTDYFYCTPSSIRFNELALELYNRLVPRLGLSVDILNTENWSIQNNILTSSLKSLNGT